MSGVPGSGGGGGSEGTPAPSLLRKRFSTDNSRTFRVTVLGNLGVGKSETKYSMTVPVDVEMINFEVIDTGSMGDGEPNLIKEEHLRWADGLLLVYDITRRQTFSPLRAYYARALEVKRVGRMPAVIVGNKLDMQHFRTVSSLEAERLGTRLGCANIEVSAAEDYSSVLNAFMLLYQEHRNQRRTAQSKTLFERLFGNRK